ncbi:hypothetical protein CDO52_08575 [Nocardiopsis gilva YIM 90087]|uniref:Aminoglycoside phosphotransferase domain-containing protein n=1 Tax=Nocardiopsis gilva YIM 90087 TaxID=1235441 RepID=A0A223S3Y5_9ACTN|nr:class V lanthionine synthetase subunit LxmK [Nocardiopsis gilva]ASU82828.1 hypothetical protein CDO52_08575 [Nocardiopsis gilva YIM 90087]
MVAIRSAGEHYSDSDSGARSLLEDIGFGVPVELTLTGKGRNYSYVAVNAAEDRVFVKRISGGSQEGEARLCRMLDFHRAERAAGSPVRTPVLLGVAEEAGVIAYEWLGAAEAVGGSDAEVRISEKVAGSCGEALASLHSWNIPREIQVDTSRPPLPPVDRLKVLPVSMYAESSGAELQLFGLLQRDDKLLAALTGLRRGEELAAAAPIHGDVRLDQFLVVNGTVHIIDWEEFRSGDPARDVGAFVGDVIFRALLRIFEDADVVEGADRSGEPFRRRILEAGEREVEAEAPVLASFWDAYFSARSPHDREFSRRAVAYAGWHLIDRVVASAQKSVHLPATLRAVMGIGRSALLAPHVHGRVFGVGG